jgi:hypothetical protein
MWESVVLATVIEVQVAVGDAGDVGERDPVGRERVLDRRDPRREALLDLGVVESRPRVEQEHPVGMDDGVRDRRPPLAPEHRLLLVRQAELRDDERDDTSLGHGGDSIPQPLHVPAIVLAVVVQVPDRAAACLDPPVLAVAAVGPPPALDPPPPDHVDHLVAAAAPLEDRRHPGVAFDPYLLVESFRHRVLVS